MWNDIETNRSKISQLTKLHKSKILTRYAHKLEKNPFPLSQKDILLTKLTWCVSKLEDRHI